MYSKGSKLYWVELNCFNQLIFKQVEIVTEYIYCVDVNVIGSEKPFRVEIPKQNLYKNKDDALSKLDYLHDQACKFNHEVVQKARHS